MAAYLDSFPLHGVLLLLFAPVMLFVTFTVWPGPGILSGVDTAALSTTGFSLPQGESQTLDASTNWSGRMWGCTLCTTESTGEFICRTGKCWSGEMECLGGGATLPAALAEFTLDGSGGMDFYDLSSVDGYRVHVVPQGADYIITFCPNSSDSIDVQPPPVLAPKLEAGTHRVSHHLVPYRRFLYRRLLGFPVFTPYSPPLPSDSSGFSRPTPSSNTLDSPEHDENQSKVTINMNMIVSVTIGVTVSFAVAVTIGYCYCGQKKTGEK